MKGLGISVKSQFLKICKSFELDFFFNMGFSPNASSFCLKNELKLPAKLWFFCRIDKSQIKVDRSR